MLLLLLAIAPIAFAFAAGQQPPRWLPTPLVHFAFDVRLATAPLAKKALSLTRGSPLDKRIHLAGAGEEVRFLSGDVPLVGSLYRPTQVVAQPGILLLHGSTPEGRRMGLYRLLAESLADHGYLVLAIDMRGYGQSGRLRDARRPDAYDYSADVHRALALLATQPGVDPVRLHVVGHSFGAGVALTAGLVAPLVSAIVALGPAAPETSEHGAAKEPADEAPSPATDGVAESPPTAPAADRSYFTRRALRYGSVVTEPGVHYIGRPAPLGSLAAEGAPLSRPDHKPVLVVSDVFEPPEVRAALAEWQRSFRGRSRLRITEDADHYLNTAGFGPVVIYDVRAVAGVVAEIDSWLGGAEGGCSAQRGCSWPGVQFVLLLGAALLLIAALLVLGWAMRRRHGGAPPQRQRALP